MRSPVQPSLTAAVLAITALCSLPLQPAEAQALWHPPALPVDQIRRSTPHPVFVPNFKLGAVTVTLEETPLRAVQRAFPGGRIGQAGEADGYVAWLCYVLRSRSQRSILWLQSFEQGGDQNAIMGFTLLPLAPNAPADARCAGLPDSVVDLRLPYPIQLGASDSQVVAALGQPTEQRGDTLGYFYQTELPSGDRTVFSNLCVILRARRVVRIDVWHFSAS